MPQVYPEVYPLARRRPLWPGCHLGGVWDGVCDPFYLRAERGAILSRTHALAGSLRRRRRG